MKYFSTKFPLSSKIESRYDFVLFIDGIPFDIVVDDL